MKIEGIIIKDVKANVYFAYIKQFPGICAQADSIESVTSKIDSYYEKFIERIKNEKVQMDKSHFETM